MVTLREKVLWLLSFFSVSVKFFLLELVRLVLMAIGWFSVGVGAFGAIPGNPLPTVPFLIFAAWCFKHSSPELLVWLQNVKYLGPVLRDWQNNKRISVRTKKIAMVSIILSFSYSIYDAENLFVKFLLLMVAVCVSWYILSRTST